MRSLQLILTLLNLILSYQLHYNIEIIDIEVEKNYIKEHICYIMSEMHKLLFYALLVLHVDECKYEYTSIMVYS